MRLAIIGAGVAGLSAGRTLLEAGLEVQLFDKGRGVGGRLATRDREQGAFDHGAQRFSARSEAFEEEVQGWARAGWVVPTERASEEPWWLPVPSSNGLARSLAAGLHVRSSMHVTGLRREKQRWRLQLRGAEDPGPFDAVLCTAPAPQTAELLAPHGLWSAELASVRYDPTWAVMLGCEPDAQLPDAIFSEAPADASVSLLVREDRKPGRAGADPLSRITLHASSAFSRAHLEDAQQDVIEHLVAALRSERPELASLRVRFASAHRWRFARVASALGTPALFDSERAVGVAGDGLLGPRIEAAWVSGKALAQQILSR